MLEDDKLVFLISLPRSGSTWLQREICSAANISSASEPWLSLPLIYSYYKHDGLTEYSGSICSAAMQEYFARFDSNATALDNATKNFLLSLYSLGVGQNDFFLEKTPRNALILPELLRVFPKSKFIILFRNPLEIALSMLDVWGKGWDTLFRFNVDYSLGMRNMLDAIERSDPRIISINYEQISKQRIKELVSALGINDTVESETSSSAGLHSNRMGDQRHKTDAPGVRKYKYGLVTRIRLIRRLQRLDKRIFHVCETTIEDCIVDVKKNTTCNLRLKELASIFIEILHTIRTKTPLQFGISIIDDHIKRFKNAVD